MKEALGESYEIFKKNSSEATTVILTGGNFGEKFALELSQDKDLMTNKKFLLSDERLNCDENKKNSFLIFEKFKKNGFFEKNLFYDFDDDKLINQFGELFDFNNVPLDICFLSVGEDGHIAGDFGNSININTFFSRTNNSPKPPKNRVSLRLDYISKTKVIVVLGMGREKRKAVKDFINGKNVKSSIFRNHKKLFLISDCLN